MKTRPLTLALLLATAPTPAAAVCVIPDADAVPPHYVDGVYINPYDEPREKSMFGYLRMRWNTPHPSYDPSEYKIPTTKTDVQALQNPPDKPQITWIGHATVLIQHKGINVITDPMFSKRASPTQWAGPARLEPLPVQLEQLPDIDYAVLSHNHYDHMDMGSMAGIGNDAVWLVPLDNRAYLNSAGIDDEQILEFDWWDQRRLDGLTVTATPSKHWSKRTPWDTNEALWAGWHLDFGDFSVWFGGDTGYNNVQFKRIGERCGPIDLALIPIGAYAPRWFMGPGHVNPEEALMIHRDVRAERSMGIHWGTFILTAEPIGEPPQRLRAAREAAGLEPDAFFVLSIGETRILGQ